MSLFAIYPIFSEISQRISGFLMNLMLSMVWVIFFFDERWKGKRFDCWFDSRWTEIFVWSICRRRYQKSRVNIEKNIRWNVNIPAKRINPVTVIEKFGGQATKFAENKKKNFSPNSIFYVERPFNFFHPFGGGGETYIKTFFLLSFSFNFDNFHPRIDLFAGKFI